MNAGIEKGSNMYRSTPGVFLMRFKPRAEGIKLTDFTQIFTFKPDTPLISLHVKIFLGTQQMFSDVTVLKHRHRGLHFFFFFWVRL